VQDDSQEPPPPPAKTDHNTSAALLGDRRGRENVTIAWSRSGLIAPAEAEVRQKFHGKRWINKPGSYQ